MGTKSRIEWTEQTWNPTVGCTKISAGCKNCYALTMANRLQAMRVAGYKNGFKLNMIPERLNEPMRRRTPTMYFVNSMSDLFHKSIPDQYIDQVLEIMCNTPRHTYQVLTKRAERLAEFWARRKVPENVWLGVSVENKRHGLPRIPFLQAVEARTRFLSVEPLLEDIGSFSLQGISWVIVGGESGVRARPMKPEWASRVRDQCEKAGVAFFFKQWGQWGEDGVRRSKKANGRLLEGELHNEFPAIA